MEMFLQGRKEEAGLNEYSDKDSSEMSISECVMPNKSSKEKESQRQGAMHDIPWIKSQVKNVSRM